METNSKTNEFKCPSCGAPLAFDPTNEVLKCSYCGYEDKIEGTVGVSENDFSSDDFQQEVWSNVFVVHCQSCGADNVLDNHDLSIKCPFCGSNQVIKSSEIPGIKPDRVLPFKVNSKDTLIGYQNWLKKKPFCPKKVKQDIPKAMISGVYLPIWTFDSETFSVYRGRLGKRHTRVVGSGKNRRVITEVTYFSISGSKKVKFDDLIINAASKVSQKEVNNIEPFDTNNSFIFDNSYLAGFSCEHYCIPLSDGWKKAQTTMYEQIKQQILLGYNYDIISSYNQKTKYYDSSYKYVLIPIWIGLYKYKNKTFRFVSNGTSGKFFGKAPVSFFKVFIVVFIILMFAVLFAYLFASTYE